MSSKVGQSGFRYVSREHNGTWRCQVVRQNGKIRIFRSGFATPQAAYDYAVYKLKKYGYSPKPFVHPKWSHKAIG